MSKVDEIKVAIDALPEEADCVQLRQWFSEKDWQKWDRQIELDSESEKDVEIGEQGEHGQRYRIDFTLTWRGRQATIRSVWNVRPSEDFPRLVTCYPIKEAGK